MPGARPYSQRRMLPKNMRPLSPKHSPVLRCVQQNGTVSCLWGSEAGRENVQGAGAVGYTRIRGSCTKNSMHLHTHRASLTPENLQHIESHQPDIALCMGI